MSVTQLSEHFSLAEMTITKSGLLNIPDHAQIIALEALCENVLEKIHAHFQRPVIVTSGFRSPEVNAAAGGKSNSQHLKGEAADIHIEGIHNADIFHFITETKDFQYDQCIAEMLSETNGAQGWVHVSYSLYQTRRDARSFIGNGKYVKGLHYAS